MIKTEAKKTSKLMHWLKSDLCQIDSCLIEVKVMRGNRFYLSAIAEHQMAALKNAKTKMAWKIPDCGYQNPVDIIYYKNAKGFLAVIKDNECYFIPVDKLEEKSMTLESIKKIANFSVIL